jgi:hypothetical protein
VILPSGVGLTPDEVTRIVRELDTQEQIDAFLATVELAEEDKLLPVLLASESTENDVAWAAVRAVAGLLVVALSRPGSYEVMRLSVPNDWGEISEAERWMRSMDAIASAERRQVTSEDLSRYRDQIDEYYREEARSHGQALADGDITLEEYHRRMVNTINEAHTVQRRLGEGGLSDSAERSLRDTLDDQLGYLDNMVGQIVAGELSEAQLVHRSGRYGGNGGLSFLMGVAAATLVEADTEQRFLGACSPHCQECVAYAAQGRVPAGTLPLPRQACSCRDNCCCRLERYNLSDSLVALIA